MKKLFLLAAVLSFSMGIAQDKPKTKSNSSPLKYGVKLGLNIAKLTDSDSGTSDTSARTGLNIGGYVHYKFNDKFAFQPELIYTAQGMKEEGVSDGVEIQLKYKLDYLAVPLMFKYYPAKRFNVELGPQIAFNVKKQLEAKGNGQTLDFDLDDFFEENGIDAKTHTVDFALNVGLGYEMDNGLNFSGRYSLGFTKVFEGNDVVDANGNAQNIQNSVFTFGLGYTF